MRRALSFWTLRLRDDPEEAPSEPDYALDDTGEDAATRAVHFPRYSEAPNDEQ